MFYFSANYSSAYLAGAAYPPLHTEFSDQRVAERKQITSLSINYIQPLLPSSNVGQLSHALVNDGQVLQSTGKSTSLTLIF
jgi:hypothetical protein